MSQHEVTMIVVSWNVCEALRACLSAAYQSHGIRMKVVVVDNASIDGTVEMVRADFPDVRLIANPTNRGFSAAVNQGLHHAQGHVLLLNPDVVLFPGTVQILCQALASFPRAGIVGPRLTYADGKPQASVKRLPRWIDLALILSKLPNWFPGISARYQATDFDYSQTQTVEQIMGSCFLIRDAAQRQLGFFDEGFFLWFEEVDYCFRAKQTGWQTVYVADAKAQHGRGQSFQQLSARTKQKYLRNSIRHYVRKHFGIIAELGLSPFLIISLVAAGVIDLFRLKKPTMAKEF